MAEPVSRGQGRRPPFTPPRRDYERRSAGRAGTIAGLVRDLVDLDRLLLGTIAVLLTAGTPFVLCLGTRPSFGYAMLTMTVCVDAVIVVRSVRNGSGNGGRGGVGGR